jgi:DNA-3-methyladenine glycosylase
MAPSRIPHVPPAPDLGSPLKRAFFGRSVHEVAPGLIGATLLVNGVGGIIVEVEAYHHTDPAAHSYRGRTERNAVMFGPPGHAYVYFTYGMWHCVNVVCQPAGEAAAVLLRAGSVVEGAETVMSRRPGARARDLARGPARLCTALAIGPDRNGVDITHAPLFLTAGEPVPDALVRTGPRVGVARAADLTWRYWIADDPAVSVYRPAVPRRRRAVSGSE